MAALPLAWHASLHSHAVRATRYALHFWLPPACAPVRLFEGVLEGDSAQPASPGTVDGRAYTLVPVSLNDYREGCIDRPIAFADHSRVRDNGDYAALVISSALPVKVSIVKVCVACTQS